jgi:UDP-N-acetylmuramoyl-tripeptide--D-alanyl-D-alanine ligase
MHILLSEAAEAVGAPLPAGASPEAVIETVSTDSRELLPGSCFVALKGEMLDGHDYVRQVVSAGAGSLIVERYFPEFSQVNQLVVPDTLFALGELARHWRQRHDLPIAVLTGSSGKTTSKEMAASIVRADRPALVTRGNFNNLIGLPKMLFELGTEHKAAVLELGMNTPGELRRLVEIAVPQCVAVTNITNAHIGMFGSEENLYQAKSDALRFSPDSAVLVMNSDDRLSQRAVAEHSRGRKVISFGFSPSADVRASAIEPLEPFGYRFMLHVKGAAPQAVNLKVFGRHNIMNALTAASIADFFEIESSLIGESLSGFQPANNRSEVEKVNGWYIIKDYYNASPAAVEQALASLSDFSVSGRRFAVLADMLELGEMESDFHNHIGNVASHAGLDLLLTTGERARSISRTAEQAGTAVEHHADSQAVAQRLQTLLQEGDLLLIKGSRLMKLERIYEILKGNSAPH